MGLPEDNTETMQWIVEEGDGSHIHNGFSSTMQSAQQLPSLSYSSLATGVPVVFNPSTDSRPAASKQTLMAVARHNH